MYKLDLPIDLKEQAAIERRRRLEKERQSRIFNNKHRLIGVFSYFLLFYFLFIKKIKLRSYFYLSFYLRFYFHMAMP